MMVDILFIYAKLKPETSYRQVTAVMKCMNVLSLIHQFHLFSYCDISLFHFDYLFSISS